jgi:HEAT repeat protein
LTSRQILIAVALVQGVALFLLVLVILTNRWIRARHRAALRPRREALDAAMRGWAMGEVGADLVVGALEALPTAAAVESLVARSTRLPGERWRALAEALVGQAWAKRVRARATSSRWWQRLQAARFLSVAATPADAPLLNRLLHDTHPAVHIAAAVALERHADPTLVETALERLPELTVPVQAYYAAALGRASAIVVPLLTQRLGGTYDPALPQYVEFAGRLADASLREPITTLATHSNPEVRVQVARALGAYPHRRSIEVLTELATDARWEIRAQAVRALGRIADPATGSLLTARLQDVEWWVRLRAALALTQLGPAGRDSLLAAEVGPHADARFVARLILGLTPQALAEFAT